MPGPASAIAPATLRALKRDPAVREIILAWRRLIAGTGIGSAKSGGGWGGGRDEGAKVTGTPTLIACSGGADSSALLLALVTATRHLTVAHIVHDLRPRDQALADRDAARTLAAALGLEFAESEVAVRRHPGNAEASARRLRYQALARIARDRHISVIATAHHAGDQLEGVVMGLVRGAGLRGLAGIAQRRPLAAADDRPLLLIRPMLTVSRADAERICRAAGWMWREDATNQDTSRRRAAVRHRIAPALRALGPAPRGPTAGIDRRIARTASLLRDAAGLVEDRAIELRARATVSGSPEPSALRWPRAALRAERSIVVGEVLRLALRELHAARGLDRLGGRVLDPIVRCIRSAATDPKRFEIGRAGIAITVSAKAVEIARKEPNVQP